MCKVQRLKRNFDGRGPAVRYDACLGSPNAFPAGVKVAAIGSAEFFHYYPVNLCTQGIDLKYVAATPIQIRIDHDFEVVVQILTRILSQLRANNLVGLRVMAVDSEIDRMPGVQD